MKETRFLRFLKYFLSVFIIILIPTYVHYYGWQNFLWLSDIGLFLTVLALWFHSSLLMSMAVVGVLFTELVWCVDYFVELLAGYNLIDLSDYMFDGGYPMALRAISLFHVFVPAIWIWYLVRYGYQKRALYYMTGLYWLVLIATYTLTDPAANINWVFLPHANPCIKFSPLGWVSFLFVAFPLFIFLPSHFLCSRLFKKVNSRL
ncbi:hypothetical protein BH09DEP1_BH09DEP1_7040 [soil metagenome]